jgi:hypothetical protein
MNTVQQWGPQHDKPTSSGGRRWPRYLSLAAFVVLLALPFWVTNVVIGISIAIMVLRVGRWIYRRVDKAGASKGVELPAGVDPLELALERTRALGGGVYLGTSGNGGGNHGGWVCARREHAVLLLGPPGPVSHCSVRVRHCANSPASDGSTWILRPLRRPAVTWMAWRSPRWT